MKSVVAVATLLAALVASGPGSAQSPLVRTQPPCAAGNCLEFDFDTPTDLTARTFEAVSPVSGAAIVTFHGMLRCAPATRSLSRLVHLESQIVKLSDDAPDAAQAGGHVIIGLLWNNLSGGPNYEASSFNLASTRTFKVREGGRLRVAFRLKRVSMSADVSCAVEQASSFTVQFVD